MKIIKNSSQQKKWILNDGSVPIQMRIIAADEINSVNHLHKSMHEYFYLLEGTMKISVAGVIHSFKRDDILVVEPGESHYITEKSPDLKLILLMPPPVPDDKVVLD